LTDWSRIAVGARLGLRKAGQHSAPVATGNSLQGRVQEIRQPHAGLFQLKLDHRVRLLLVGRSDRRGIPVAQVAICNRLRQPVALHHPIFDGPFYPFRSIWCGNVALQLRRRLILIAVDVFQQAGVLHPMQVVGLAVEYDVPPISALVAVVLVMQGLVHVADEVNDEPERLSLLC
jgi:hypothetical protein